MGTPSQRDAFLQGEGDAWFKRNVRVLDTDIERRAADDPIIAAVKHHRVKPRRILEIGASNGWRLWLLQQLTGAESIGVEPSERAVAAARARYPGIVMHRGTADTLPCGDSEVDLLILGFCLYVCDRADLFRIAAECDRVLADGGRLMILDFHSSVPWRNPYVHLPGMYAYKMQYDTMFSWNPAYRIAEQRLTDHAGGAGDDPADRLALTVLVKDSAGAYVDNPYRPKP